MTHGVLPIVRLALLKYAFTRLCQEGEAVCDLLHMELTPAESWSPAYHPRRNPSSTNPLTNEEASARSVCRRMQSPRRDPHVPDSDQVFFIIGAERRPRLRPRAAYDERAR